MDRLVDRWMAAREKCVDFQEVVKEAEKKAKSDQRDAQRALELAERSRAELDDLIAQAKELNQKALDIWTSPP